MYVFEFFSLLVVTSSSMSISSKNFVATFSNASPGHSVNQSIVQQLTNEGNILKVEKYLSFFIFEREKYYISHILQHKPFISEDYSNVMFCECQNSDDIFSLHVINVFDKKMYTKKVQKCIIFCKRHFIFSSRK